MYVEVVKKSSTLKLGLTGVMRLFGCSAANALMQRTVELVDRSRQTQSSGTRTIKIEANVSQLERRAHYAEKNPQHRKKFQSWLSKVREIDDPDPGSVQTSAGASAT